MKPRHDRAAPGPCCRYRVKRRVRRTCRSCWTRCSPGWPRSRAAGTATRRWALGGHARGGARAVGAGRPADRARPRSGRAGGRGRARCSRSATGSRWSTRGSRRRATVLERLGMIPVDGFLVDLGVSSPQLDRAERGFSFRTDGPLDMRMDPTTGETAAELLRRVDEDELTRIIRDYGEERHAARVARAIIEARRAGPLETDRQAGGHRRARAAPPRARQEPGDADLPGAAHRRQRRAGRAGAVPGRSRRTACARAGGCA